MRKQLSVFEAACIVAGNGIGGGLMALPFLAQNVGWPATIAILTAAWLVTVILHIMVADMLLNAKHGSGILSVFNEYLFRGKWQKVLTAAFFLLLLLTLLFNLSAYVSGGADILTALLGLSPASSKFIFYGASVVIPLLGLKALGFSEKTMILIMSAATLVLTALSLSHSGAPLGAAPQSGTGLIALYGLAMFSFSALFSVPQAVDGLGRNPKNVKKAIAAGVGINYVMSLLICFASLYASETVTEVAIVGWSAALGTPVKIVGSLLILFAMATSFWAISLALSDMVCEQLNARRFKWLVFLCSTLPCFLLSVFSGASFTSFVGIAGGAVAVIIALLLLPAYRISLTRGAGALAGEHGGKLWLTLLIGAGYLLMAAGSVMAAF